MTGMILVSIFAGLAAAHGADPARIEQAAEAAASIEISFVRDELRSPDDEEENSPCERMADLCFEEKRPLRWPGFVIDPKGRVLAADPGFRLERIGEIRIRCRDGFVFPARVGGIYTAYGAVWFEPAQPVARAFPYVRFARKDLRFGDLFHTLGFTYISRDVHLHLSPDRVNLLTFDPSGGARALAGVKTERDPFPGKLILDAEGTPIGFQVEYDLWDGSDGTTTYAAAAIEDGARIPAPEWSAIRTRIAERLHPSTRKVRVYLQSVKADEDEPDTTDFGSFPRRFPLARDGRTVLELYGFAVPGGRILVPHDLGRSIARMIARTTVEEGGREVDVRYEGLFAAWGGFIVESPPGIPPVPVERDRSIRRGELFVAHSIAERFGRRHEETDYNRWYNASSGYEDRDDIVPFKPMRAGTLILDREGGLIGLCVAEKRPGEEIRASSPYDYRSREERLRVFPLREVAEAILDPKGAIDPQAVPVPRVEALRPVWLGVEYQSVSRDLMDLAGLLAPTKDGAVGLLVTRVYAGSPAENLGLAPGDVILSARKAGEPAPIEFLASDAEDEDDFRSSYFGPDDFDEYGTNYAMAPRRIWKPCLNFLTRTLARIGEGQRVEIAWVEGKTKAAKRSEIVLEKGPKDFDSADRWKDRTIGVTVRDLTYEVRASLQLEPDAPGVVISRVEPGSKAQIRRLRPYELIARIDESPVASAAKYREAIEAAISSGRGSVKLQVLSFGESRIVTIDLAAAEGPEEKGAP